MSLRALFLLLLLANLAFLAWANLIDVAPAPPRNDSISHLPRLELLSEAKAKAKATAKAPTGPGEPADATAAPDGADHAAESAPAGASPVAAPSTGAATADVSHRCITVGPFADSERAIAAADLLRDRGFTPQPRTEPAAPQGFWVFIGGLKSASDETGVVQRLERSGIADAKAMPAAEGARRVSVGLFNARDGAERRARAVRRLGLDAQIEPRQAGAAQWIDVDLGSSAQSLPAEGLLSLQDGGSRLEIKECPGARGGGDTGGGPTSPTMSSGKPKPPASTPSPTPVVPTSLTAKGSPRPG